MTSKFLSSVIRWEVARKGSERFLPYLYYNNFWIAGIYTASTSKGLPSFVIFSHHTI